MTARDRAEALVALVESDLAMRTRAVLDPAASEARELTRAARRAARSRVSTALAEERGAFEARIAAAEARLATARRMATQRRLKVLLAEGWEILPGSLAARWADAGARAEWIAAALAHALAVLPRGTWEIHGPASWSIPERTQAMALLGREGVEAKCATAPGIEAGIRVLAGNVELDATPAGLLADRQRVEGRLLAHFDTEGAA